MAESRELLQEMERALLHLEDSTDDLDAVNSLFRSAHTIKGSSGIVGIESVEKFTHVVENLLSRVRDNEISVSKELIGLLLECRDHIVHLIDLESALITPFPAHTVEKESVLTSRLCEYTGNTVAAAAPAGTVAAEDVTTGSRLASTDAWHISIRFGHDVFRDGMDPVSFMNYLARLGEIISVTTVFEAMPPAGEMDPESCYLGFELDFKSDFDKKTIEDVFEFVREDSRIHILPPRSRIESYVELINGAEEDPVLLGEILVKGGALTRAELDDALLVQDAAAPSQGSADNDKKGLIGEILVKEGMVHPEVVDAAVEKQKNAQVIKSKEASTIRIDAAKLDQLINLVGELVISNANVNQHTQRVRDTALIESASVMARLVEEVRESSMRLRMVPIGETFSRFNRVVRDISRECGKDIALLVNGADTELDKTVVEKISDPLMHIVRNAADHGIEDPDTRVSRNKPARGTIRLNAYHDAGSIVIEVADDGKGLSRMRILDKAIEKGLVAQGQDLTDSEIFSLIFEPGFSTAEKITKLSGRGVGMDVVKRNIEALRGTVEVESTEGAGTTVRIRLPLTLAIIDGFMVCVGGSYYVVPLDMVIECVELPASERDRDSKRRYVNLRGTVLPYIRLREFFAQSGPQSRYENVVVVRYGDTKIGIVVDGLVGEVQTVIKSLGSVYRDVEAVSGATILGDGTVALILDVPRLIQAVERAAA